MIEKIKGFINKAGHAFFYLFLVFAGLSTISQIMNLVRVSQFGEAATIVFAVFVMLWNIAIYGAGIYFLLKKNNEHTRIYFTLILGYSIVSYFYNAWNWIEVFAPLYQPNFFEVSYLIFIAITCIAEAVFAISYVLKLFLKKDYLEYGIYCGLFVTFVAQVLLVLVTFIGSLSSNLDPSPFFTTLPLPIYILIMAIALPLLEGKDIEYSTFGQKKDASNEVASLEDDKLEAEESVKE